jgi:hypothetical protein
MKANNAKTFRTSPRRKIEPLEVSSVNFMENLTKFARKGEIVEASISGFLLIIKREELVPKTLRENLSLESIVGSTVLIHLPQMDLEISGKIARTKLLGKKGFEIGVDYSADSPEYWRECLLDLLPAPGEFDEQ